MQKSRNYSLKKTNPNHSTFLICFCALRFPFFLPASQSNPFSFLNEIKRFHLTLVPLRGFFLLLSLCSRLLIFCSLSGAFVNLLFLNIFHPIYALPYRVDYLSFVLFFPFFPCALAHCFLSSFFIYAMRSFLLYDCGCVVRCPFFRPFFMISNQYMYADYIKSFFNCLDMA